MQFDLKNNFEKACDEAFILACQRLLEKGIPSCSDNTGAQVYKISENHYQIKIAYLNRAICISAPEFTFSAEDTQDISMREKILILHYLCNGDGAPQNNTLINFKQLRSGNTYYPSFEGRCLKPLVRLFNERPVHVTEHLKHLGGEEVSFGDWAIKLQAFSSVPVIFVIWKADDEFPAEGNILFDTSIESYLSTEDIVVLCQQIVLQIIKAALNVRS